MTSLRTKRIVMVVSIFSGVCLATTLILFAFEQNLLYFYTPDQVIAGEATTTQEFRVGGLVLEDSVTYNPQELEVSFILTANNAQLTIHYQGILPDLFREGQGIIARGSLDDNNIFQAVEVLAKHDEQYMPPEVAESIAPQHNQQNPVYE